MLVAEIGFCNFAGDHMKAKKILFIIAAFFSVISALLPYYIVCHEGMTFNGFPVIDETAISLFHCYYGIGILAAACMAVAFLLMGKKYLYAGAVVANAVFSIIGFFNMMNYRITDAGNIEIPGQFFSPFAALEYNTITEIKNGAGYYLLIVSVIFLLVMMLINFAKSEE